MKSFTEHLFRKAYKDIYIRRLEIAIERTEIFCPFPILIKNITDRAFENSLTRQVFAAYGTDKAKMCKTAIRRLREYMIEKGLVEPKVNLLTKGAFANVEVKLRSYIDQERNYDPKYQWRILKEFLELTKTLQSLDINDFWLIDQQIIFQHLKIRRPGNSMAVALRALLKFLFRDGFVRDDYSGLIMSRRVNERDSRKFLSPTEINTLLAHMPRNTIKEKRDYAMYLLMARLGLRVLEVTRLRLIDVDWSKGRIFIRGKHSKTNSLPFSQEVGDAIIDYIRSSKRGDSEHIFLNVKPPFRRIVRAEKIIKPLKRAYTESGINPPTKAYRLNVFRHSYATQKLREGVPITKVRELLRHELVDTTMIYARYHLEALRSLAPTWPGSVS